MTIELDEFGCLCVDGARVEVRRDAITVWPFHDAPADLKALSSCGGDEDWLALIPPSLADLYIGWIQEGGPFGCCSVDEFALPGGWHVYIGSHA